MTIGERIKHTLGLDNYKYVVFERILGFPVKAIAVYYNSRRPNIPLTTDLLHRKFHFLSIRKPPFDKDYPVTPILPIEYYNSGTDPAVIFTLDIGGDFTDPTKQIPRKNESIENYQPRLDEWVTLSALKNTASIDAFTRKHRDIRNKAVGTENTTAKLINCVYNEQLDCLTFIFRTTATTPIYPKKYQFKKVNPTLDFSLSNNDEKVYYSHIRILEFMKWLKDTRPDEMADQPITWREIKDVLEAAYVQVFCNCLRGDTGIKLLDGRVIEIKDLVKEFQEGKELWVYSTDEHGNFKPGKVTEAFISGYSSDFIRVTLDNGKQIETTTNHLYMMRDGSYKEASSLKVGDSLMPLYFRDTDNGYELVKHNYGDYGYYSVYKEVAKEVFEEEVFESARDRDPDRCCVTHHIDFNKKNNSPSNLRIMGREEHYRYHYENIMYRREHDPEFRRKLHEANVKHLRELNANPTEALIKSREIWLQKGRDWIQENKELHRELTIKGIHKYYEEHPEEGEIRSKKLLAFYETERGQEKKEAFGNYVKERWASEEGRKDYMDNLYTPFRDNKEYGIIGSQKAKERLASMTKEEKQELERKKIAPKYKRILEAMIEQSISLTWENMRTFGSKHPRKLAKCFTSFEDMLEYLGYRNYNHKIVSIEHIHTETEPVYDITVDKWSNFYVDSGVILHNCGAFHWQGSNYWLSQLDGSIFPTDIEPKVWNAPNLHGDGQNFLCKHLYGIIRQISFFGNQMASMADKELRKLGKI